MNILLVGQGSVLASCAEVLRANGAAFSVITPKETFASSLAGVRMAALGIPVMEFATAELFEHIRSAPKPLLIFSIVNHAIFPPDIAEREDITIINYHNALLSKHRGRHCEAWQIYCQDTFAGVTWHYVDSGIDTGRVICQSAIPLPPDITSIRLLDLQGRCAVRLLREDLFPQVLAGTLWKGKRRKESAETDSAPSSLHFSWEKPNHGILNLAWMADKVWAFMRAMDYGCLHTLGFPALPWEGAFYTWQNYIGEGVLQDTLEGACLDGHTLTLSYSAGRIALQGCMPVEQKTAGMKTR